VSGGSDFESSTLDDVGLSRDRRGAGSDFPDELDHLRALVRASGVVVDEIALPSDKDILANGIRLHYLDWEGAAKRPIIFLHGGGLTAHTWDVICLALRSRFRCYALDLRGHGDSEWSSNLRYGLDEHAQDLAAFIEDRHLEQTVLVGMSLGGLASLRYAADNAHNLALLVIVDIGPSIQEGGTRRIREFMSQGVESQTFDAYVAQAAAFNPNRDLKLLRSNLRHNLHELPDGTWAWKYDRRHRGRWPSAVETQRLQLWEAVGRIDCDTLVLRGGRSDVFSAQNAEELSASLPNGSWLEVSAAGHTIHGDNPAGFLAAIDPLLRALE
jgi:pimeloyl-ACP methyl ester carboxylesterase